MARDAVIVDAVRTASGKGKPGGALSGVHPVDLLATVLRELDAYEVNEAFAPEGGGMANATIIERL